MNTEESRILEFDAVILQNEGMDAANTDTKYSDLRDNLDNTI